MSWPSTRMVGEPRKRVCSAACWSGTSITRTSALLASCVPTRSTSAMAASRLGQPWKVNTSTRGRGLAGGGEAELVAAMSGRGDAAAGGHVVAVVVQQPVGELQDGRDPVVGQPVV